MRRRRDVSNKSVSATYQLQRHDDVSAWSATSRPIWDVATTFHARWECCPLEGCCLRECMVYEAKVSTKDNFKLYYGRCERQFKSRFYNNHKKSFRDRGNETELSKYIWQLKDESKNYNIRWKIFMYATPYKFVTRRCDLCLTEICLCVCRSGIFTKQENWNHLYMSP